MKFQSIVKISFVLLVGGMLMTKTAIAATRDDVIKCPSVDKIHKAASLIVRGWMQDGLYYDIAEAAFEDSDVSWSLVAEDIRASSFEEATAIGQNRATKVTQMLYQNAEYLFSGPECFYYDATLQNPYISIIAKGKTKK